VLGVLVNTAAILVGSLVGLLVNKGIPERFSKAIMTGLSLVVIYIGISGAFDSENLIIMAISIMLGTATGTALRIDDRLNTLGKKLEQRFTKTEEATPTPTAETTPTTTPAVPARPSPPPNKPSFAKGFVNGSLLFCVGAMAIIGSIDSGISGDHSTLFAKSTLDLVAAAMLAVSLGVGVVFSAASVFIYQGSLVMLAQLLRPLLENPAMIAEIRGAGSLIIVALGLNMIGLTKIKVADLLPAIIFAPILVWAIERFL